MNKELKKKECTEMVNLLTIGILQIIISQKKQKSVLYSPSEKGFLAMDDEIFIETEYQISDDRKTLTIDKKACTRIE